MPIPKRSITHSLSAQALAGAVWLACAPLAAQAPPPTAPSPAQRETARSLMDEGERLRTAGDLRGALGRFQAAHAILHIPTTGLQLARVHAGLGELVEARGLALEAANHPAATGEPQVFADARRQAAELAADLAAKIPSIQLQVAPAGAAYSLSIDGASVPEASRGLPYRTDPGLHDLLVEAPGFAPVRKQVRLDEREAQVLTLTLTRQAPGLQPSASADISPFAAAQSATTADSAPDDKAASAKLTRAYVGFAAGGAVLLTGVITGIVSAAKASGLKDRCGGQDCARNESSAISSANTFANIANVSIPLGLAGIGYGLYEFLTLPAAKDSSTARLELRWEGASATLRGSL